ncbi:type VII toxin-antitoxin system HepT family RNase toxin [Roseiflexus castenholzii]|jgi:uncharacterized protein YutE (UPF0331/DUF86 family)|uniref:DUF86 domain-containing protein n=1 Tax=Roseiflexus castenholzii (strain DSM 13941 / HLO8) TaxID=383372 RepID=A7NND8_ROSCS|nr:DUF86 domain-containing protein [Roseiflexus castenholzii]ABU59071.1 protein of unknown function DUF86 [Roseiflexus castenholzii DSM 13941]
MRERLLRLEVNVRELARFRQMYTSEDVRREPHLEWALRYGLLEAIQIVIDLSCHIASEKSLGAPATYAECVDLLSRAGLLSGDVAKAVSGMVGLRNILVQEYISVDLNRLYNLLDRLDDFRTFAEQIRPYV